MISICLSISGDQLERQVNMIEVVKWLSRQSFQDYEFIVVEQLTQYNKQPFWYNFLRKMIKLEECRNAIERLRYTVISDSLWCQPWVQNVAARMSTTDTLLFTESDVVFASSSYLEDLVNEFTRLKVPNLWGWNVHVNMGLDAVKYYREKHLEPPFDVDYVYHHHLNAPGNPLMCQKSFFFHLGGYSERLVGHCGCDVELAARIFGMEGSKESFKASKLHIKHKYFAFEGGWTDDYHFAMSKPSYVCELLRSVPFGDFHQRHPVVYR